MKIYSKLMSRTKKTPKTRQSDEESIEIQPEQLRVRYIDVHIVELHAALHVAARRRCRWLRVAGVGIEQRILKGNVLK